MAVRPGRQLLGAIIDLVSENSVSITIRHGKLPKEAAAKSRCCARMPIYRGVG